MAENWKDISGYGGDYQVSDCGRVRGVDRTIEYNGIARLQRGKVLKLKRNNRGYLIARLRCNGIEKNELVHRLVAAAFIGIPEEGQEINHLDGDKANNVPGNLEWCTRSENLVHAYESGLRVARWGTATGVAKLKPSDVLQARRWYHSGKYSQSEIARIFSVCPSTISRAVRGELWANL